MATRGITELRSNGVDFTINDPNIANEFSSSAVYVKGQFVNYQGDLYQFTEEHAAGAWNANHAVKKMVGNKVQELHDDNRTALYKTERIAELTSETENLCDQGLMFDGFINEDGTLLTTASYASYYTTQMIPIRALTAYLLGSYRKSDDGQSSGRKAFLCFDANKEPIASSYTNQSGSLKISFTSAATAAYIRISAAKDENIMLKYGESSDVLGSYIEYKNKGILDPSVGMNDTIKDEVNARISRIGTVGSETVNMFNPDDTDTGFLQQDGSLIRGRVYDGYLTSNLIAVKKSTQYTVSTFRKTDSVQTTGRKICLCYDEKGKAIQTTYVNNTGYAIQVTTTAETAFIRVCASNEENVRVAEGNNSTPWAAYTAKGIFDPVFGLNDTMRTQVQAMISAGSRFNGLDILNIGDSIAEDRPEARSYAYQFAQITSAVLAADYAESGSTLSLIESQGTRGCILTQAQTAITEHGSDNFDIILIDGCTNDDNQGRTIGAVTGTSGAYAAADYTATFDETTILGATEKIFQILRNQYPGAVMVFVMPHKNDHTGTRWMSITDGIREACNKWSIPVLDIWKEGELNTRIEAMKIFSDQGGTHPNTLGIQRFYVPKLIALLSEYFI